MILTGKEVKEAQIDEISKRLKTLNRVVKLVIIVVGENKASAVYVRNKIKFCNMQNIETQLIKLPETVTQDELESIIMKYNIDNTVHGIFTQLPLPKHLDEKRINMVINPKKDIDGFSHHQIGNLFLNEPGLYPCTVEAIFDFFEYYNIEVKGKHIVVAGRSNIVGKPLVLKLINHGATVSACNSKTNNIRGLIDSADIFISVIGIAKYFDISYFENKKDLTIIDVGMNRDENNKLCGDIDFENVQEKVKNITPVPGGIGLLTVVNVVKNVIKAAELQNE